jgi:hypothetical protein
MTNLNFEDMLLNYVNDRLVGFVDYQDKGSSTSSEH